MRCAYACSPGARGLALFSPRDGGTMRVYPLFARARITSADIVATRHDDSPGSASASTTPISTRRWRPERFHPAAGTVLPRDVQLLPVRVAAPPCPARGRMFTLGLLPRGIAAVCAVFVGIAHALAAEPRTLPRRTARSPARPAAARCGACIHSRPRPLGGRVPQPGPARSWLLDDLGGAAPALVRAPFRRGGRQGWSAGPPQARPRGGNARSDARGINNFPHLSSTPADVSYVPA